MKVMYKLKLLVSRRRAAKKRAAEENPAAAADAQEIEALIAQRRSFRKESLSLTLSTPATSEPRYLGVGLGISASPTSTFHSPAFPGDGGVGGEGEGVWDGGVAVVSDSPVAVDFNVYDRAYEEELKRIVASPLRRTSSLFLNNQVKGREQIRAMADVLDGERGRRRGYPGRGREGDRQVEEEGGE